jgi:hypothetical protein
MDGRLEIIYWGADAAVVISRAPAADAVSA